jgi:hypothetical protein
MTGASIARSIASRRLAGRVVYRWLTAGLIFSAACGNDRAEQATDADGGSDHSGHTGAEGGGTGHHQCGDPYPKDPRDDTMTGELVRVLTDDNGTPDDASDDEYDLLLPQEMLDWLNEQDWVQEHGDWHNIRRCTMGCQRTQAGTPCQSMEALTSRGLSCAPIQEGEPGDGYAFLIMHRHMIRGFQQAFPKHVELIRGFYHLPMSKTDPENAIPWVDVRWSSDQLKSIDFMDNITQNIDVFTTEDDYAKWVQFGDNFFGAGGAGFPGGGLPDGFVPPDGGLPDGFVPPNGGFPDLQGGAGGAGNSDAGTAGAGAAGDGATSNRPPGGLHGALHGQWSVPGSPYSLVNNNTNVQNFAFWRLHVWLDEMWERFRRARGLGEDAADYQQALIEQCEEMHTLGQAAPPEDAGAPTSDPASQETGVFATQIAPILNTYCGGSACHGADSPTLGLALTGAPPSQVRLGLVGQRASEVALSLVEPGNPDQSWLYRKLSGNFDGVDCSGTQCTAMPLAGAKPSDDQIALIRAWIAAGATTD